MTSDDTEPQVLEEPVEDRKPDFDDEVDNVWMRGLWMLVFAIFYRVGEVVLGVSALVQFFWMLFAREKNPHIVGFGEDLADWLARAARFLTGATEERPFPFDRWGRRD